MANDSAGFGEGLFGEFLFAGEGSTAGAIRGLRCIVLAVDKPRAKVKRVKA